MRSNCVDHDGHWSVPMSASYHQAMGSISRRYCWWSFVISIFTWDGQREILQQGYLWCGLSNRSSPPQSSQFLHENRIGLGWFLPTHSPTINRRYCTEKLFRPATSTRQISTTERKAKTGGFVLLQTELGVNLGLERIQWIISFIILKLLSLSEGN